ncbi:serine hydrolase domain-containing protein [Pseudonocardia sp. CA-107938]|uniref:serine hydrolase domain-containing protein n=1 Tax=Pseudonocardia sp. CA-107938 TaxID=3240021 RepID=UPI003D8C265F
MASLKIDAEPAEVGLDAARLQRVDTHFQRYLDDGRLAGWSVAITRRGRVVHYSHAGVTDLDTGAPVTDDVLWRIYSMTKPVTSVAAMMLVERGLIDLNEPVSRFIPAFGDTRVYVAGSAGNPATVPATEPIRVWHLLTHTAGLTYGWHHAHAVDEIYRSRGFEFGTPRGVDLAGACDVWASWPLLFEPGSAWNYSVATDVLGRVVEVASGQPLDRFFADEITGPLGMTDTGFAAPEDELHRLPPVYTMTAEGLRPNAFFAGTGSRTPTMLSGGGGLVSTAGDYHRFTQMLLRGGELDGVRLLSPRTVAHMTRNHLPGNADLDTFGRRLFAESTNVGVGFGLGFSVVLDPVASKALTSVGEYAWGGMASTAFYIDPVEEITAMFFTQFVPSSTYPIRPQLRALVTQAVVD